MEQSKNLVVRSDAEPALDHHHDTNRVPHPSHEVKTLTGRCVHCKLHVRWPGILDPCAAHRIDIGTFRRAVKRELVALEEKFGEKTMTWEGWRRALARMEGT